MNIGIDRDELLAALGKVSSVVEARNTIPILSNLLIDAADGRLTITSTNLDIQASVTVATISGEMRTTVDATKLVAAVGGMKAGVLRIEAVTGRHAVTMKQGRSVRTLPTLPATDFPMRDMPSDDAARFVMPATAMFRLLDACHVAQSTEEARYYLKGIFLHVFEAPGGMMLRAAATDGHRLMRAEVDMPDGAATMRDAIVPIKAVTILRRLLAKSTEIASIVVAPKSICVRVGDVGLHAKLIDGTFPDYSRVIPEAASTSLVIGRAALVDAIRSVVAMVTEDRTRAIAINLAAADGPEVRVTADAGASACEPLEGALTGRPFDFGLNGQYVRSIAEAFAENAMLTMTLDDPAAPMRITSDKDPDIVGVIMPMRV